MNIEFIATVAVIAPDPMHSRDLYVDALGLPLQGEGDGYRHSERIAGCKSFGIWPLSEAAQACFGTKQWPAERLVPQVSIEFDVANAAGGCSSGAGTRASWLRAVARGSRGAMGPDGRPAAVTRGRGYRHLLHAGVTRLTPTADRGPEPATLVRGDPSAPERKEHAGGERTDRRDRSRPCDNAD